MESTKQLEMCLALAAEPKRQQEAEQAFQQIRDRYGEGDASANELIDALWKEVLSARRSAAFWESTSNLEKEISERMAESNFRLQQNYLRLVQEQ